MRPALSLHDLLAGRARSHPDRPALSDGVRSLDYRALHTAAGRVAAHLHGLGAGRGDRVAVLGPRDGRVCALLYGVLRSGAAAVLVDPSWSAADVRARLDSVSVRHVLSTDGAVLAPGGYRTEVLDVDALAAAGPVDPPVPATAPETEPDADAAYLSFTSGSSGEPKAVAVTHANAVHYARSLRRRLGLTRADAPCVAHVTTMAADLGHTSWLLALATGGSVHVVPDHETRDPEAFWASLDAAGVSVLKTTPSHLTALLEGRPTGSTPLRTLLLGGETLPRPLAADLLSGGVADRVVNHYGPTETTIGATCFVAASPADLPADEASVPVGTAIGEVGLFLVGPDGLPVPDGVEGELLIGGRGVTAGYFGRPDETALRFVRHGGERMYRTGDTCRRRPDGNLVFTGRTDRQVKIRGFRVDPAEVEWVIGEFPGVSQSAVFVRETASGGQLLAAVRTAGGDDGDGTLDALRSHLHDRLPGYSVPQPIVALPDFPTGPNGKLDRERLAAVVDGVLEGGASRAAPGREAVPERIEMPVVRAVAELWASALGLPFVDPHADVLALGGDSILAMRTVTLLRRSGYRVAFEDFYRSPTPMLLASVARRAGDGADGGGPAAQEGDGTGRLAPAQRWLFRQRIGDHRHWNQSAVLRCGVSVEPAALSAAVEEVLRRHPALRQPVGPDGPGLPRPAEDVEAVTFSSLPRTTGHLAEAVEATCSELQRGLDPQAGRLIRIHLFSGGHGVQDRLAVIVHHLASDGLSWRILLDDLAHAYRAAVSGRAADLPPTADFYRWAATAPPAPGVPEPAEDAAGGPHRAGGTGATGGAQRSAGSGGTAGDTEPVALTWALDESATARLVRRHGRAQRLEAFLLSALAEAALRWSGRSRLGVEVETHGRDTTGAGGDHMDTVGWFTAVKHVVVDHPVRAVRAATTGSTARARRDGRTDRDGGAVAATALRGPDGHAAGADTPAARVREVERRVREAPELPMDTAGPRPEVGFNFLGTFELPDEPTLRWSVAPEAGGAARCAGGDPLYRMRLTARIVEGRLVTDLVYAWPRLSHDAAHGVVASFGRAVAAEAGATPLPHTRSPVSTSGRLLYTGTAPPAPRVRVLGEPTRVLLTGATGYVGRHLLAELVARGARVTCLVRGERDADAALRLSPGPDGHGAGRGGFDVVAGDIDREGLGLSREGLARVRGAQVVVHAAADVRLVAPPADLERTNDTAVRRLLGWIDAEVPGARLHHLSTLAVAGGVDGPARRFSEADLRIGQGFRTPYERTKFAAEEAVRSWAASGRQCYVHRSGHVAAHSRTGAFQANVEDNRVYQLVRGYVLAGAAPSRPTESFAFSHVDTVAAGIAAIVTHPYAAPGTYHVETPHTVPHDELVAWLVGMGHPIALTGDDGFAAALAGVERTRPTAARLASAWSQLEDRNVVVDSSSTTAALDRVGVRFAPPTPEWWSAAMEWAAGVGFLPEPGADVHDEGNDPHHER
ncbi:amino acid adenylation domain-containing protein [Nocardiopsis sp. CT-R113]|uniref:Amino acid adenylation domain-containing protein n=2 Tax=Nocardiopsis codii TaxID=3065942 RepID=A0ABU7K533_9ACTN|nr:amino acid adenylation domain-containing protein [Nocardiopsis sp. CT-R113]MEE2037356.1 amino acid adenylation domain-containing protein [Nocardiopsis sp. CT-R113]